MICRVAKFRWHVTRMTKAEKEECDSYTTPLPLSAPQRGAVDCDGLAINSMRMIRQVAGKCGFWGGQTGGTER